MGCTCSSPCLLAFISSAALLAECTLTNFKFSIVFPSFVRPELCSKCISSLCSPLRLQCMPPLREAAEEWAAVPCCGLVVPRPSSTESIRMHLPPFTHMEEWKSSNLVSYTDSSIPARSHHRMCIKLSEEYVPDPCSVFSSSTNNCACTNFTKNAFNATMAVTDVSKIASCTSCQFDEDLSNYWTAAIYFKARNGTYKVSEGVQGYRGSH